jgi:hypothetical protein
MPDFTELETLPIVQVIPRTARNNIYQLTLWKLYFEAQVRLSGHTLH